MSKTKRDQPSSLSDVQHGGRHYKDLAIQPAEYNQKNRIPFCEAEAIKYLTRHEFKNGEEDIRKAIHFCCVVLDMTYGLQTKVLYGDAALDTVVDLSSLPPAGDSTPPPNETLANELPVTLHCGKISVTTMPGNGLFTSAVGEHTQESFVLHAQFLMRQWIPAAMAELFTAFYRTKEPVPTSFMENAAKPLKHLPSVDQSSRESVSEDTADDFSKQLATQRDFDVTIGELDRLLSKLVGWGKGCEYCEKLADYNGQTLKHHAEDMQLAAAKILECLGEDF